MQSIPVLYSQVYPLSDDRTVALISASRRSVSKTVLDTPDACLFTSPSPFGSPNRTDARIPVYIEAGWGLAIEPSVPRRRGQLQALRLP